MVMSLGNNFSDDEPIFKPSGYCEDGDRMVSQSACMECNVRDCPASGGKHSGVKAEKPDCSVIQKENSFYLATEDLDKIPGDKRKIFLGKRLTKKKFRTKRESKHFFKKYGGFGMNKKLLEKLKDRGVETIIIEYNGRSRIVYKINIEDWFFYGKQVQNNLKPNDVQLVLSTKDMRGSE